MTSPKASKHDKIVYSLVERLMTKTLRTKNLVSISTMLEYQAGRRNGEIDVLTRTNDNVYHFYEVKSRHYPGALKKAQKQFNRFKSSYPSRKIKGVYVTPTKIKRLDYII